MERIDLDRLGRGADHQQRAVDAEPVDQRRHGLAARHRGEDHLGAAERHQRRGGILGLAVDVAMRAELERELRLVLAASDGDRVEAHLCGELHGKMPEPADAVNGDDIARLRAGIAQRIESGDAGAEQRRRGGGVKLVGNRRQGVDRRDHVIGIAAVIMDAGHFEIAAGDEVAAAAAVADEASPAEPADADPLAGLPGGDVGADGVDPPGDLVSRHRGVVHAGKGAGGDEGVAMADAAGLDLDAYLAGTGLRYRPFDELEGGVRLGDLDDAHGELLRGQGDLLSRRYGPR